MTSVERIILIKGAFSASSLSSRLKERWAKALWEERQCFQLNKDIVLQGAFPKYCIDVKIEDL